MDNLWAQGFHEENELYRFMREHHPDLIRKGKKGFIGSGHMMKAFLKQRRS
jgi:hypothetical protein